MSLVIYMPLIRYNSYKPIQNEGYTTTLTHNVLSIFRENYYTSPPTTQQIAINVIFYPV